MKKKYSITIAIFTLLVSFNSCKYEDGPTLSLRTKKARLVGKWYQTEPALNEGAKYYYEFKSNDDFTSGGSFMLDGEEQSYSSDGMWEWDSNKEKVKIIYGPVDEYKINVTRLTNKELWFKIDNDENIYKYNKD